MKMSNAEIVRRIEAGTNIVYNGDGYTRTVPIKDIVNYPTLRAFLRPRYSLDFTVEYGMFIYVAISEIV